MKVTQSCPTLCDPMDCTVQGIFQPRILEWVAFPSTGDIPNPGIEPRYTALQTDSLPVEPQGKPQNTAVSSLSLLQQIFPTQESNWGLLHCRKILYQLSYQGSWAGVEESLLTSCVTFNKSFKCFNLQLLFYEMGIMSHLYYEHNWHLSVSKHYKLYNISYKS